MAKKPPKAETQFIPDNVERFSLTLTPQDAARYLFLHIYTFGNTNYQVVSVLAAQENVTIEFVRLQ